MPVSWDQSNQSESIVTLIHVVRRFQKDDVIATRVPLSEAARKIREEKGAIGENSADGPSQEFVTLGDEQFEWREIIRGIINVL